MKAGWHKTTLGAVAQVGAGNSAPQGDALFNDGIYPFFRTSDAGRVRFGDIAESSDYLNDVGIKGLRLLPAGTILFPKSGASTFLNHRVMMAVDGYVSSHLATIVGDESKVDRRFLLYFLSTVSAQDLVQDHSYPSLNLPLISGIPVLLPPLPEQHRIVAILDEAFDGIAKARANAEQNRQNARALFESHLQSVFTQRGEGWVVKKVSEIAKHSLGKMRDKAKNKGEPQPYLRNMNVRWFTFDLSDLLEMPFLPTEAEKYTAVKGDVLICEGGYPGRAAIWNEDYPIYFQKALHRVRFHEPELNKWFVYYLSVQSSSGQLKKHFSGTGIQHFTGEVLARFPIPVPPLPELRLAVAKFDELSDETQRLESIYQQKLAALDELKKSLLHQAFSGSL
jgi:type I restriction enzyme S subunit